MISKRLIVPIIILITIFSACSPDGAPVAEVGPHTWLDAPLDGMVIPLAPYKLVFHAASDMPVSEFEVSVAGEVVGMADALNGQTNGDGKNLYRGEFLWHPPEPGRYLLEVRAHTNGDQAGQPAAAMVVVMDMPEAVPDAEPDADLPPSPVMPTFDTAMFYFRGSCSPQLVTVDFMLADPDIFNVVLFFRLEDVSSGKKTEWTGVAMDPIGDDYYRRRVGSAQVPDVEMFQEAWFQVQIVVTRQDGSEIMRTEVVYQAVKLLACGQAPPSQPTSPSAPPTPTPYPTIPPPK